MNEKTSGIRPGMTTEQFRAFGARHLPGLLGVEIVSVSEGSVESRLEVRQDVMAPNGYLHAATVIALADTLCAYGTGETRPPDSRSFTACAPNSRSVSS